VRFTFPDTRKRARSLRILRRWAERDVAVSLLSHGDELSLFCECSVLDRALGRAR